MPRGDGVRTDDHRERIHKGQRVGKACCPKDASDVSDVPDESDDTSAPTTSYSVSFREALRRETSRLSQRTLSPSGYPRYKRGASTSPVFSYDVSSSLTSRSRGYLRYSNDALFASNVSKKKDPSASGAPGALCEVYATHLARTRGYLVVSMSSGSLCVVSVMSGKVTRLEAERGVTSVAVWSVGIGSRERQEQQEQQKSQGVVVVAAGYGNGNVRVWSGDGDAFVAVPVVTGVHGAGVTGLAFVDVVREGSGRWSARGGIQKEGHAYDVVLLSVDGHGRVAGQVMTNVAREVSARDFGALSTSLLSGWEALKRVGVGIGSEGFQQQQQQQQCVTQGHLVDVVGRVHKMFVGGGGGGGDGKLMVGEGEKIGVGEVAAVCARGRETWVAVLGGADEGVGSEGSEGVCDETSVVIWRLTERDGSSGESSESGTVFRIVCPGAVQDAVFLHDGSFLGVVHFDDASGRTLLTLLSLDTRSFVPGGASISSPTQSPTLFVTSEDTATQQMEYTQTDLYDIYVRGSAVGGDETDDVMLLTSSGVRCVQLMSWKQKLSAMVAARRFEEALKHAVRLYCDDGKDGSIDGTWPANRAGDATAVSKQILSLLLMYVEQTIGDDVEERGILVGEEPHALVRLALDVCLVVDEVSSAFYQDLPPLFQRSTVMWNAYLDVVMEHCLSLPTSSGGRERELQRMQVPTQIIQSLVEHVVDYDGIDDDITCCDDGDATAPSSGSRSSSAISKLEDVLLSFEVSSLDLNQVLPLCIKHGLYSVLIYVFTRGMKDFKSPAALLLAKAAKPTSTDAAREALTSRLLVYVYACFEGLAYPLGLKYPENRTEEAKTTMRLEMMDFLLFGTVAQVREAVDLWESLGGREADGSDALDGLEPFEHVSSPVLAFLCDVDATTTLGLLRDLLSAWDGLVSDIETQIDVPGHTTLSQATVDRVVELIDCRDGDDQDRVDSVAARAKLDFVALLVSSNRASLPPAATLSVLTFLSRSMDIENTRQNFLNIVAHAPVEALGDDVLELVRSTGMTSAEADILLKRGAYRKAIRCLLQSECDVERAFSCYRDVVERGGETASAFQEAIIPDFPTLVDVDARATAEIAVDLASHQHKEIMETFEKDSSTQFRFLDAIVTLLRERTAMPSLTNLDAYETSPWIVFLKGKTMTNVYIKLMCRFDPTSVLEYLQMADYDVDECLDCCRAHGLRVAQAYLLDRKGDLEGAFRMYMEEIDAINAEIIVATVASDALTAKAGAACDATVSLCARARCGDGDGEAQDGKYMELVAAYVHGYMQNATNEWGQELFMRLVKRVAQRASRPEAVVEYVINTFEDVPARDLKGVLAALLNVCNFDARKTAIAADIAKGDVGAMLRRVYLRLATGRDRSVV